LGLEDGMAELVRGSKWQDYTSSEHGIITYPSFHCLSLLNVYKEL
jgi:hypothetical protein